MKKFNVKEIKVRGLSGEIREDVNVGESLGNLLYEKTSTLDWLQHSKDIYNHLEIELSEQKLTQLVSIIVHPQANLSLMIKDAILKYLELITTEPQEVKED